MSALAVEATTAEAALERLPIGAARLGRPRVRLVAAPPAAEAPVADGPPLAQVPTLHDRVRVLRASDREPVAEAEGDGAANAMPTIDPAATAVAIALAAIEALGGRRPVAQLARWLTPGVYDVLRTTAAMTTRVLGASAGRHPVVRRRRVCEVGPTAVEVAVVADDGVRVRAVAIRLEALRGTWRATSLEIG